MGFRELRCDGVDGRGAPFDLLWFAGHDINVCLMHEISGKPSNIQYLPYLSSTSQTASYNLRAQL